VPGLRRAIDERLGQAATLLDAADVVVTEGPMLGRTGWG
jgi:hypothetical protein